MAASSANVASQHSLIESGAVVSINGGEQYECGGVLFPGVETNTHRSAGNKQTTTRLNWQAISSAFNRPESHLIAFICLSTGVALILDDSDQALLSGEHDPDQLQYLVFDFIERYVLDGSSARTVIATVKNRAGSKKLRLRGPDNEFNLSSKKLGDADEGMLTVIERDPMPGATQMASAYQQHCLRFPKAPEQKVDTAAPIGTAGGLASEVVASAAAAVNAAVAEVAPVVVAPAPVAVTPAPAPAPVVVAPAAPVVVAPAPAPAPVAVAPAPAPAARPTPEASTVEILAALQHQSAVTSVQVHQSTAPVYTHQYQSYQQQQQHTSECSILHPAQKLEFDRKSRELSEALEQLSHSHSKASGQTQFQQDFQYSEANQPASNGKMQPMQTSGSILDPHQKEAFDLRTKKLEDELNRMRPVNNAPLLQENYHKQQTGYPKAQMQPSRNTLSNLTQPSKGVGNLMSYSHSTGMVPRAPSLW